MKYCCFALKRLLEDGYIDDENDVCFTKRVYCGDYENTYETLIYCPFCGERL